jgi:predicted nucleotidyltransferase
MVHAESLIEKILARRAARHTESILPKARAALERLEASGIKAWLVGSLANKRATAFSDADFLVEGPREIISRAFDLIEAEMDGYPFDIVQLDQLDQSKAAVFMSGALDASCLRERCG